MVERAGHPAGGWAGGPRPDGRGGFDVHRVADGSGRVNTFLVATPGHTPGHTCYLQPGQRILFAGDALFTRDGLSAPPAQYTADMGRALESIQHLSHLTYDVACFGHGAPVVEQACTLVDRLVETF